MTTWIITADSSRARILQVMDRDLRLAEVEDFSDPEGRIGLGDYLEGARTAHRFDRLHLVAAPKFLGQLRKELGTEVRKMLTEELPKDLSWLDARALAARFAKGNIK